MEVAAGDRRQPRVGDPAEELRAVEELEAVRERAQPGVAREPLREASRTGSGSSAFGCAATSAAPASAAVLMASAIPLSTETNSRRPIATACAASTGSSSLNVELEAGDDKHPVGAPRALGLALDLGEVQRETHLVDRAEASPSSRATGRGAHDVVGDAEDVEAAAAMKVDELGDSELAVAPAGVGVELAEQGTEVLRIALRVPCDLAEVVGEKWLISRKEGVRAGLGKLGAS